MHTEKNTHPTWLNRLPQAEIHMHVMDPDQETTQGVLQTPSMLPPSPYNKYCFSISASYNMQCFVSGFFCWNTIQFMHIVCVVPYYIALGKFLQCIRFIVDGHLSSFWLWITWIVNHMNILVCTLINLSDEYKFALVPHPHSFLEGTLSPEQKLFLQVVVKQIWKRKAIQRFVF